MKKYVLGIVCIILLGFVACASLITDEQYDQLKLYEEQTYVMVKNIKLNDESRLKKGEVVKLYLIPTDEWIKVYAYSTQETFLQSKRTLILYLFESDFKNEKFTQDEFNARLREVVRPK